MKNFEKFYQQYDQNHPIHQHVKKIGSQIFFDAYEVFKAENERLIREKNKAVLELEKVKEVSEARKIKLGLYSQTIEAMGERIKLLEAKIGKV